MSPGPAGAAAATELTLCRLEEIRDGQARGFTLRPPDAAATESGGLPPRDLEIFVYRSGPRVHGYLNVCPHIGAPLDWGPDRFMSDDGKLLRCATHGALFRPDDGHCVSGPCEGDRLTAIDVSVKDGAVVFRPA